MANHTSITGPRPLDCEEWIAMLTDALDGVLPASDAVAFHAHRETCLACAQLLEEAQRGAEWLRFLAAEPEVPAGLADRILAHTTGPETTTGGGLPLLAPAGGGLPPEQAWFGSAGFGSARFGGSLSLLYRHPAESRLLMTVAMAFFSIAFTLNLAGVRLKELHVRDLRPSVLATGVSRGYYSASARVMRYYENLRFVYELESRVNELRRSSEETAPPASGNGKQPSGTNMPQPSGNTTPHAPGGGAAQQSSPPDRPPSLLHHEGGSFGDAGALPARIIPVNLPPHARAPVSSPSRSAESADGAHTYAPFTYTRDQAKRSLA